MNQETLNHHAKLHEWHDLHVLHSKLGCSAGTESHYLPPKKLHQIESWRQEVNQCLNPPKKLQKKQLFMRISSSYLTGRPGKITDSTKRRCQSAKVRKNSERSVTTGRVSSARCRTRNGATDLHTVTNNIVDSSLHYSAQRQEIYSRPSSGKDRSIAVNNRAVLNGDTDAKNWTAELEKTHKLNGWVNHEDKREVNNSSSRENFLSSKVDKSKTGLESGKVTRNGHSGGEKRDKILEKVLQESMNIGQINDSEEFKSDNEEQVKTEKVDNHKQQNSDFNADSVRKDKHNSNSKADKTEKESGNTGEIVNSTQKKQKENNDSESDKINEKFNLKLLPNSKHLEQENENADDKLDSNYTTAEDQKSGCTSSSTEEGKRSEISDPDMESPGRLIHVKNRPIITSRSSSNKILNFYSIDDCKLTCRYRPNTLREREPRIKVTLAEKSETNKTEKIDEEEEIVIEHDKSISHRNKTENDIFSQNPGETGASVPNGVENAKHVNGDTNYDIETITSVFDDTVTLSKTASLSSHYDDKNFMSSRSDVTLLDLQSNNISDTTVVSESITNPSNYGRITSLNAPSEHIIQREKKQFSRPVRVSRAIDIMVDDRKVMNTMDRDFDGRTKMVGRTIIEKNEGSETFKRMNQRLKKQIEDLMHKRSAQVYQVYHKRKNSESGSVSGSVKS